MRQCQLHVGSGGGIPLLLLLSQSHTPFSSLNLPACVQKNKRLRSSLVTLQFIFCFFKATAPTAKVQMQKTLPAQMHQRAAL
jgi:hypothetical protein